MAGARIKNSNTNRGLEMKTRRSNGLPTVAAKSSRPNRSLRMARVTKLKETYRGASDSWQTVKSPGTRNRPIRKDYLTSQSMEFVRTNTATVIRDDRAMLTASAKLRPVQGQW